ncbi:MAG: Cna B-type [Nostoc sp.]|uniref:Cna B-type n=1 Tax=Nostoc sp. TaxID=1180 RepID=UPI002FF90685
MIYQTPTPSPTATIVHLEDISCQKPVDASISKEKRIIVGAIATPTPPETLPAEFSPISSQELCANKQLAKEVLTQTVKPQLLAKPSATSDNDKASETSIDKNNALPNTATENTIAEAKNLLLAVIINNQEVGSLDVVRDGNTLLLPLLDFAQIAGFTVEPTSEGLKLKTPSGVVILAENELQQIKGISYISDTLLKEKVATYIKFNSSDLALIVDLPWRRNSGDLSTKAADLLPEVVPPSSGLSTFREELNFYSNSGNNSLSSSTLIGGRLAGGSWRVRLDNNFVNQPDVTEYYFFKRTGQFLYQIGRQQIGLHNLLTNINLTGLQVGYTNLPINRFNNSYGANELLPRRSQATQTFRGIVPPTSFVQLRVSGIVVAQQQVGFSGKYEFIDVNLPGSQSNEIELYIYDRNNPNVPKEIRSLRLNVSDLLLPSGGNVQLAGVGFSGNTIQNTLFEDYSSSDSGKLVGFYQVRQGISNDLTLEGAVQILPDTTQAQAGFAWRLANPVILAASVGTSHGQLGYTADLDIELNRLQIIGNSELYPSGYWYSSQSRDYIQHSLEANYRFSNNFTLGLIGRSFQDQSNSANYILPTFSLHPFPQLSLSGRPDVLGRYLFNAFYQATPNSRLSFTSSGDIYSTDFSQNLSREYLVSFGTESGGDLPTRYTLTLNRNAPSFSGLSWRLGVGYRDGEVGPVVGGSMRLIPGLFARVDYEGIPSRYQSIYGGIGENRLTISLVSDLSFAGGRITPSEYTSLGKDRGGIAGRVIVEGGRKGFDLSGSNIQVFNNRNQSFGGSAIDSQGNFFVGNLPEGVYIVQFDPDQLPVELSIKKTSVVAEVANSAVTKLDFPVKVEYGLAGRITDAAGKPIPEIEVELINAEGKRISASASDEFGLYRLDAVPVGKYILRIPPQDGITNNSNLPTREITIDKDFLYDQNLQLPFARTTKETKDK